MEKGVATQVKTVARKHYDAMQYGYLLQKRQLLFLQDELPAISNKLDTFLDELPPYNYNFVVGQREWSSVDRWVMYVSISQKLNTATFLINN